MAGEHLDGHHQNGGGGREQRNHRGEEYQPTQDTFNRTRTEAIRREATRRAREIQNLISVNVTELESAYQNINELNYYLYRGMASGHIPVEQYYAQLMLFLRTQVDNYFLFVPTRINQIRAQIRQSRTWIQGLLGELFANRRVQYRAKNLLREREGGIVQQAAAALEQTRTGLEGEVQAILNDLTRWLESFQQFNDVTSQLFNALQEYYAPTELDTQRYEQQQIQLADELEDNGPGVQLELGEHYEEVIPQATPRGRWNFAELFQHYHEVLQRMQETPLRNPVPLANIAWVEAQIFVEDDYETDSEPEDL